MALKIVLKPHERMIFGGTVVTNGSTKCELLIETNTSILREKDIITEEQADSPCKRLYLVIQLMYVDEKNLVCYHTAYWKLVRELVDAAPSVLGMIDQISEHILSNEYYQALKLVKKLIEYEQEVLQNAHLRT
jgi:flagellar biosynthesis repressor protein FlbT